MEGKTFTYQSTEGVGKSVVAFFDEQTGIFQPKGDGDELKGLTFVYDQLGRTTASYMFSQDKKFDILTDSFNETVDQGAFRMYPATWMDTEIMGYECQAFFVRERVAFANTFVYWVSNHQDLVNLRHPDNFKFPNLPGFVMAYSWSTRSRFEVMDISNTIDPYLFGPEGSEEMSPEARRLRRQVNNVLMPLFGNRILKTATNLYRLFAG